MANGPPRDHQLGFLLWSRSLQYFSVWSSQSRISIRQAEDFSKRRLSVNSLQASSNQTRLSRYVLFWADLYFWTSTKIFQLSVSIQFQSSQKFRLGKLLGSNWYCQEKISDYRLNALIDNIHPCFLAVTANALVLDVWSILAALLEFQTRFQYYAELYLCVFDAKHESVKTHFFK